MVSWIQKAQQLLVKVQKAFEEGERAVSEVAETGKVSKWSLFAAGLALVVSALAQPDEQKK